MPNKYLDSVGLAEYTTLIKTALADKLPLSGGAITGNLSVSGTITGNVTGNVTGNADTATNATNATKATNDGNGNPIASTYLPLSGGTLTGTITNTQSVLAKRDVDTASIILYAGKDNTSSYIAAWGKNNSSTAGVIQLRCSDGTNVSGLLAYPDGTLTWAGKNVERVNSIGSNYIRYENGIQICWGGTSTITTATTVTVTLPASFVNTDYMLAGGRWWVASAAEEYYFKDKTTTNFKLVTIGTVGGGNHYYMYIAIGKWK